MNLENIRWNLEKIDSATTKSKKLKGALNVIISEDPQRSN